MCGSSQPTTPDKTTQIAELPEWARGYAKDALAKGSALTDINQNPYQQYGGERIAGFSPMQQQAFQGAANMQPSQQLGLGSDIAGAAGIGALGTNYQGRNFRGGQFDNQAAEQYMNPYTQNVIDYQKSQALRDFQIAQPVRQAQAVQQGAFGGSRSAIVDAEAQRGLNSQLQGITATGQQAAFQNAQQQFNADQARRLQAQGMSESSRQYGAGLGMQGLQTGLQAAGQLGQLGQTQYGQQMGINQLQSQYGQQQQQQAQRPLDMAYQDFQNQQNYPYKQLGFMSDLIRGLPLGQQSTSSVYEAPGSTMGQLAGLGLGAYGISRMMAEGGLTGYAEGGDVTSDQNVESIMSKLSDEQLAQAKQAALGRQDVEQANMIDAEIAQRASIRGGLGGAFNQIPVEQQEQMMAGGGIVAFADRGAVVEKPKKGLPASVETAIAKTAEKTGESEFDLRAETQKNVEMFKRDYQPLLEQINKSVEEARPDSEAIKQQGLGQALAQFGFKMAAAASRPKAKFLESASIAAPELSSAAAKTQDLIATQQQNYNRLKMDQAKYEVALQNGNMRDAAILAGQIRSARQADKQLAATIDQNNRTYEVQKEQLGIQRQQVAATAARQPENLRDIAAMLRKDDPSLTMSQALERASRIRYGAAADINAGQKDRSALSRDLIEIDKEFSPMILQSDSAAGKKSRIERQQRIDRLYQSYGLTPPSGEDAPASTISPSAFKIEKIGK
jgi:hypothetical protein